MNKKVNQLELNTFLWEKREVIFEDLEGIGYKVPLIGASYRINPCPYCGHYDCCTIGENAEGTPLGSCFSNACGEGFTFTKLIIKCYEAKETNPFKRIKDLLNIDISINNVCEEEKKSYEIMEIATEHYHQQLLANEKALNYLLKERKHSIETIKLFKIGYIGKKYELREKLKADGYSEKELDNAQIWPQEGLLIYPYYYGDNIVRVNAKNPFGIKKSNGNPIKGYSSAEKFLYTVPGKGFSKTVILVEGENDLQTLYEQGASNVIASGGKLSEKQIKQLARYEVIYVFADNDEAGQKLTETVNKDLPQVKVFQIKYDESFNDPDDYYKKNDNPKSVEALLKKAVPLENDSYAIEIKGSEIKLLNRNYVIQFQVNKLDYKTKKYFGDFHYYVNGEVCDLKIGIFLDKLGKKYFKYIDTINISLYEYFNGNMEGVDLFDLLQRCKYSHEKQNILRKAAEIILNSEDEDAMLESIKNKFGNHIQEDILKMLNVVKNQNLDPNKHYPFMCVSQALTSFIVQVIYTLI